MEFRFWFAFLWWLRLLSISINIIQSFEICLLRVLCLSLYLIFFIRLFVLLMSSFLRSLYILHISPLSDVGLVKIFSHSVSCCFVLFTVSFALQKLLSFRRSRLLIISFSVCAIGVILRKWSPVPMCSSVLPTLSSIRFSVVRFLLRFLIHLELSFVCGDRYGFMFFYMLISS